MDVLLSLKKLVWPLQLRLRRPGDRFRPLGMARDKKLKCFLIDRKVPRPRRDAVPLLVDGEDEILWIPGVEISEKARLDGADGEKALLVTAVMEDANRTQRG